MIALRSQTYRVLTTGLNKEESRFINGLAVKYQSEVIAADSEMELWDLARRQHFDLCVLGQSALFPHPTLWIWCIRSLQPNAGIAILYDEIGAVETSPIEECERVELFQRPADLNPIQALLQTEEIPEFRSEKIPAIAGRAAVESHHE